MMDIAEVARRSGVAVSALRFYEEKGLIASAGRHGLRRLFDPAVVERLALITLGTAAGLTLDEIARMFSADGTVRVNRALLRQKAGELHGRIRRLAAMRDGLRHAAVCTASDHLECPRFRRLLGIAVKERQGKSGARQRARQGTVPRR